MPIMYAPQQTVKKIKNHNEVNQIKVVLFHQEVAFFDGQRFLSRKLGRSRLVDTVKSINPVAHETVVNLV